MLRLGCCEHDRSFAKAPSRFAPLKKNPKGIGPGIFFLKS